ELYSLCLHDALPIYRMLDLGFMPQLTTINKAADHRLRQTLLFSATLEHAEVDELALALLKNPYRVAVGTAYQQHQDISQRFYLADRKSTRLNSSHVK